MLKRPGTGSGITGRQILRDCAVGKALTVDGDAEVGERPSLRYPARELPDIAGPAEPPADDAGGIVVAPDHGDRDSGGVEASKHLHEEQARAMVGPIAIEHITSNDNQVDALIDREVDQLLERAPGCANELFGLLAGPLPQARQRAIEVEIRRMNETHVPPHWGMMLNFPPQRSAWGRHEGSDK